MILVRLNTDLVESCEEVLSKNLSNIKIEWQPRSSACVVLASKGYPNKAQTGDIICGLDIAKSIKGVNIFHAGTAKNADKEFITAGGRVLGVTATAENLDKALQKAYQAVGKISFNGMQFRRDIGK